MDDELTSMGKLGFHHFDQVPDLRTADLCKFRSIDKREWRRFVSCKWLYQSKNAVVLGPHGIGKTYLSAAFCHEAIQAGYSIRRTTHSNIDRAIGRGIDEPFTNLLIVDDFLPALPNDDKDEQLWAFLDDRHSHDAVMLITTLPFHCWRLADNPKLLRYANAILMNSIILEIKAVPCTGMRAPN